MMKKVCVFALLLAHIFLVLGCASTNQKRSLRDVYGSTEPTEVQNSNDGSWQRAEQKSENVYTSQEASQVPAQVGYKNEAITQGTTKGTTTQNNVEVVTSNRVEDKSNQSSSQRPTRVELPATQVESKEGQVDATKAPRGDPEKNSKKDNNILKKKPSRGRGKLLVAESDLELEENEYHDESFFDSDIVMRGQEPDSDEDEEIENDESHVLNFNGVVTSFFSSNEGKNTFYRFLDLLLMVLVAVASLEFYFLIRRYLPQSSLKWLNSIITIFVLDIVYLILIGSFVIKIIEQQI